MIHEDKLLGDKFKLYSGDCLEVLKTLSGESVDSVVTDPPAGISFMGKEWDHHKGGRNEWIKWMSNVMRECLRVLKPGGHALVWAIPRTSHWTATAVEDAGFEIRDVVTHLFGSGFPKSLDISKAIDKAAGAEREVVGHQNYSAPDIRGNAYDQEHVGDRERLGVPITAPSTDSAKQWSGWGTALKPASEHWILARKPCSEKTVAANVLKWSTGAINVDASRIKQEQNDKSGSCAICGKNKNGARNDSDELPGVRQGNARSEASRGSNEDKNVREDLPLESNERSAQCSLEGRTLSGQPGIHSHKDAERVYSRASRGDGGSVGSTAACIRGRASSQRDPVRQSSREPGTDSECRCSYNGAPFDSMPDHGSPTAQAVGRWPANLVLSHSPNCTDDACDMFDCPVSMLDEQSGHLISKYGKQGKTNATGIFHGKQPADVLNKTNAFIGDSGGASRFFYVAKASKSDKNAGCEGLPLKKLQDFAEGTKRKLVAHAEDEKHPNLPRQNFHPTVKSTKLMRYLIRMVTPTGGTVLDPFTGSGSTGVAALKEGFNFIGIEKEPEYHAIAQKRIEHEVSP